MDLFDSLVDDFACLGSRPMLFIAGLSLSDVGERYGLTYASREGSGFIYDAQGRSVTNDQVVGGGASVRVVFIDGSMCCVTAVGMGEDDRTYTILLLVSYLSEGG